MDGIVFMLGTVVIEGGLFLMLMNLLTTGERERDREEARRRSLPGREELPRAA